MQVNYIPLIEKDAMWAGMLEEVLTDNHIPFVSEPLHGAGFTIRTGIQERVRILVPAGYREQAEDLAARLFPSDFA